MIGQEHIQNPIVCPDTTTIYILSLTEQGECEILADTVRILVIEKSDSITWTGDTIICDSASTFILNFFPTDTTVASISWYLPPIATITGGNGFNLINIEWSTLPDTIVPIIAHIYYYGGCDTTDTLWVYPCCWDTTRIMLRSGTLSSSLGSIASNQQYIVYGVLNIDDDFTFDNCDVIMAPGAIIAVYVGKNLTVTDHSHIHGCEKLWQSILTVNNSSSVVIDGSSIIEDAEAAIWAYGGGQITLNQAIFNKNYVGLKIENCGSQIADVSQSYFSCGSGLLYTTPALLLPPRQNTESKAHIEILNTTAQTIGNTSNENWFINATFGIYANNVSNLEVINNDFHNMNAGYNQTGPIGGGQLIYTGNGVCAVGQGASDAVYVTNDNEFFNCDVGVKAQFYQRGTIVVEENKFYDCKTAGIGFGLNSDKTNINVIRNQIYANPNKSVSWGIYGTSNNGTKIRISKNEIYFANQDNLDRQGIALRDIASSANSHTAFLIDSNYIEGATRGIWVENMGGATLNLQNLCSYSLAPDHDVNIIAGATSDNTIFDNDIFMELVDGSSYSHSCDGIAIDNSSTVLTSCNYVGCVAEVNAGYASNYCYNWIPNGIRQDLGFANWIYNNETKNLGNGLFFSGDVQPLTWLGWNKMENIQRSGLFLNYGVLGPVNWGLFGWNQWVNWPSNGTPHSETWGQGTQGNLTTFYVPTTAAAEYQPTNNLYSFPAISAMNQPVNASSALAEGYVCVSPELYDDIEEYCDNIGYMIIPVINDTNSLSNAFDSTARWENHFEVYKLLKADTTEYYMSDTTLTAFVERNDTTDIGLLYKSEKAVSTMWNEKGSDLDDEIAELVSLSPTRPAAQSMKTALLAALTLHAEDRNPDSTETAELETLAVLCPYEYGSSVHTARAILSLYDTTFVIRLNPCEIPVEPELRKKDPNQGGLNKNNLTIGLYPNPSDGVLNFDVSSENIGTLAGYDITGRQIYSQTKTWAGKSEFRIKDLPTGIYLFKYVGQNISKQWKIVVSR
ncbi:MAG: T9SS type A sorting domain-containing protein [Bacteroidia bacterium]|nr:T9SS type A sorting domain-containing protein [Bacteroidia bacterium]